MNRHLLFVTVVTLVACFVQPAFLLCQNDSSKTSSETEKVYLVGHDGVTPPRSIYAARSHVR